VKITVFSQVTNNKSYVREQILLVLGNVAAVSYSNQLGTLGGPRTIRGTAKSPGRDGTGRDGTAICSPSGAA